MEQKMDVRGRGKILRKKPKISHPTVYSTLTSVYTFINTEGA
jgi:hypothetical protein